MSVKLCSTEGRQSELGSQTVSLRSLNEFGQPVIGRCVSLPQSSTACNSGPWKFLVPSSNVLSTSPVLRCEEHWNGHVTISCACMKRPGRKGSSWLSSQG